jgi:hypothetical protein
MRDVDPSKITNLRDLAKYIDANSDRIYVMDGDAPKPLAALSGGRALTWMSRFIVSGQPPAVSTQPPLVPSEGVSFKNNGATSG